ncbi:hypothetical protein APA_2976 [Pseudanabaena sp. lw0831]|nr:hypothetical protein APA_2976 [Pseudanabaena sp. lw0831]
MYLIPNVSNAWGLYLASLALALTESSYSDYIGDFSFLTAVCGQTQIQKPVKSAALQHF